MFFPYLRRQVFSHVWLARSLLLLAILTTGVVFWLFLRRPVSVVGGWLWSFSHTSLPQHSGRTNFLILGVAGGDHEGPDLTDTMIFFSVDESKKDALVLSLPRDLWSHLLEPNLTLHITMVRKKQQLREDCCWLNQQFPKLLANLLILPLFSTFHCSVGLLILWGEWT